MKKIIILLVFLYCAVVSYGQALDSSLNIFNDLRGNTWYKKSGVPSWQIDGYRAKIVNGDTLVRGYSGVYRAEEVEVYADGSDMSTSLQNAFDYSGIKYLSFGSDSTRTYIFSSSINAHGGTIRLEGGNKLSGTATIDSLIINADDYDYVIDTTLTFTNLKSAKGYFTPYNFGAKGDGSTNDVRIFQKATDVAADNNMLFVIPLGKYYLDGSLNLKKGASLISQPGAKINIKEGTQFIVNDSVLMKDNNIEVTTGGSNVDIIFRSSLSDTAYGIEIIGNKIQAHRRGANVIALAKVSGVTIEGNYIDSSNNKGIQIMDASNIYVTRNRVTNSGRSGICMSSDIRRAYVRFNYGKGSAQNQNLNDGVFDIYGPNVEDVTFEGNYAETGDTSYNGNQLHILYRFQGFKRLKVINNVAVSTSQHLLYAYRFGNRNDYISEDVEAAGNEAYIKGSYGNIVSIQGVKNLSFRDYLFDIDSLTATPTSNYNAFRVSTEPGILDTVQYLDLSGGKIRSYNNSLIFLYNTANITSLNMNGSNISGMKDGLLANTTYNINNLQWIGGQLKSAVTGSSAALSIPNVIRSVQLIGLSAQNKNNSNLWNLSSGYDGTAIIQGNIMNGYRAKESGGGQYGTSTTTNTSLTINYPDSTGVLYTNRAGNQTVNTPSASIWKGRIIIAASQNGGSSYTLINGDTLRNGESATYHSDGSTWRKISQVKSTGSTDFTPIYDSLSNHNVRLTALENIANTKDTAYLKNAEESVGQFVYFPPTLDTAKIKVLKAEGDLLTDSTETEVIVRTRGNITFTPVFTDVLNYTSATLNYAFYVNNDSTIDLQVSVQIVSDATDTDTEFTITNPIAALSSWGGLVGDGVAEDANKAQPIIPNSNVIVRKNSGTTATSTVRFYAEAGTMDLFFRYQIRVK